MDSQEVEIKVEPTDWCGESNPGYEPPNFSLDRVKSESEGFERLARSSYSAAINLAHRGIMSPKREEEGEEEQRGGAAFGFVDVAATQPSEQCCTTGTDPLAISTGPWCYKRAVLDVMKRTMLDHSSRIETDEPPDPGRDSTKTRVGGQGTNSTPSGCAFNSGSTVATQCAQEECKPELNIGARTATESETSELNTECTKTPPQGDMMEEAESTSPQAKAVLPNRTSDDSHERTYDTSERPAANLAHNAAKPHACDICKARFSTRSNLVDHKLTHTERKRFKCDVCNGGFSKLSNLKKHKILHTGKKPYACDVCDARFYYKADVVLHKRSHTGEKPYHCDLCDAKFSHGSALIKHKRSHTGDRPYCCDLCGLKFAQRTNLTTHIQRHSRERKSFSCQVCNENFSTQQDLMLHKIMQKRKNLCL